jgi:hypothetical protein
MIHSSPLYVVLLLQAAVIHFLVPRVQADQLALNPYDFLHIQKILSLISPGNDEESNPGQIAETEGHGTSLHKVALNAMVGY